MTSRRRPRCWNTAAGLLAVLSVFAASIVSAEDIPTLSLDSLMELGPELSLPTDVAVGKDGRIYVVDSGNHQIAVFATNGSRIATLGKRGSEPGQLEKPVGLGIGPKGEIYVADKGNKRLQMYAANGRFRRTIDLKEDGDSIDPVDVAVSANGKELYVSANNSHRIVVFSSSGKFLRAWGGEGEDPGKFRYPATLALDQAGNIFVVDVLNQRVQKFDSHGRLLASFGGLGGRPGTLFRPKGIALDSAGHCYISDSFLGVIQVFDAAGEFLHVLGEDGQSTVFNTPLGLTINDSRLFVVQMLAGNVLVLQLEAQP